MTNLDPIEFPNSHFNAKDSKQIAIVDESVKIIAVCYDDPARPSLYKTYLTGLEVGDVVVCETNLRTGACNGTSTGRVVNLNPSINWSDSKVLKWAIAKVDMAYLNQLQTREAEIVAKIAEAEATDERRKLRDKLAAHSAKLMDDLTAIAPPATDPE